MDWQLGREVGGGLEGCEGDWESGEAVGAGGCVNKVLSKRKSRQLYSMSPS